MRARLVVRRGQRIRAVVEHAVRLRVSRIDDPDLASSRDADHPRSDTVGIQRVLSRAIVAGCEHDGDTTFGNLLGRFVDRIMRIERAGRAPGVVHDFDVVLLLVIEDVVESGERPEDEQDVAGADSNEVRSRGDTRVIAVRRRSHARGNARDVGAVADGCLGVRQILDDQRRAFANGFRRVFSEGKQIILVVENLHVLHGVLRIGEVGVVQTIDAAVQDRDADAFAGDARGVNGVGVDRGNTLVQHVPVELLVGVDALEPRQRGDRQELRRRGQCRDHREVVVLHDSRARIQDAGCDRVQRRLRLIEIDEVNRGGIGVRSCREVGAGRRPGDLLSLVAGHKGEHCTGSDKPPVHRSSGSEVTPRPANRVPHWNAWKQKGRAASRPGRCSSGATATLAPYAPARIGAAALPYRAADGTRPAAPRHPRAA